MFENDKIPSPAAAHYLSIGKPIERRGVPMRIHAMAGFSLHTNNPPEYVEVEMARPRTFAAEYLSLFFNVLKLEKNAPYLV